MNQWINEWGRYRAARAAKNYLNKQIISTNQLIINKINKMQQRISPVQNRNQSNTHVPRHCIVSSYGKFLERNSVEYEMERLQKSSSSKVKSDTIWSQNFYLSPDSSIGHLVTDWIPPSLEFHTTHCWKTRPQSTLIDLWVWWPLRHVIRVIRRLDLTIT